MGVRKAAAEGLLAYCGRVGQGLAERIVELLTELATDAEQSAWQRTSARVMVLPA